MRTSEERVTELHRRMAAMEEEKRRRADRLQGAVICVSGLAAAILLALLIAQVPTGSSPTGIGSATASVFASHGALKYIVVALLAFCLGTLVTVLCFRLKRRREERRDG